MTTLSRVAVAFPLVIAALTLNAQGRSLGPVDGHNLSPTDTGRVAVGAQAPDFRVQSLDRGVIALSDYRGKKNIVLVFYRGHW
jgi:cytochrome oxidase Cu insertion factor (SCO1/SenC/PrrC family)